MEDREITLFFFAAVFSVITYLIFEELFWRYLRKISAKEMKWFNGILIVLISYIINLVIVGFIMSFI